MNQKCPGCNTPFEKEAGYFVGAMIAAYFLGILLVAPTLIMSLFVFQLSIPLAITIGVIQLLVMTPVLFRFSRLLWIQLEYRLNISAQVK